MFIVHNEAIIDKLIKDNTDEIKYIYIAGRFYAVAYVMLILSDEFWQLGRREFEITEELISSFPPPRQSLDFVTQDLLKKVPVVFFECPGADGVYQRFDGRHRLTGAWRLGITSVDSIWVPRNVWGKYIMGKRVHGKKHDYEPYSWSRIPFTDVNMSKTHIEPCFEIPERVVPRSSMTISSLANSMMTPSNGAPLNGVDMSCLIPNVGKNAAIKPSRQLED